jgi:hypothetical protein
MELLVCSEGFDQQGRQHAEAQTKYLLGMAKTSWNGPRKIIVFESAM